MARTMQKEAVYPSGLRSLQAGAAQLGVSLATLRGWIRAGRLEHVRFGRRILLRPEALDRFVSGHVVPPARQPHPTSGSAVLDRSRR